MSSGKIPVSEFSKAAMRIMKLLPHNILVFLLFIALQDLDAQTNFPEEYNIKWTSQSENSSESMPCGGGDIGLNVWVENDEVLFYIARSGTFDEYNTLLKLGRVRLKLSPNPFKQGDFSQQLQLADGNILIQASNKELAVNLSVWVNVFEPVFYVDIEGDRQFELEAAYENWRFEDRLLRKNESFQNSYKWTPPAGLKMYKDEVRFQDEGIVFYHRNRSDSSMFDISVHQQGMDSVKHLMYNPLKNLTFGGMISGENLKMHDSNDGVYQDTPFKVWSLKSKQASQSHQLAIFLHTDQAETIGTWEEGLSQLIKENKNNKEEAREASAEWWRSYWERSFIVVEPEVSAVDNQEWQIGRNYQLFRYMLGCNAYGSYPTKFNGGLFTYDPCLVDSNRCFTPDYRNWGGGTHAAQNQRLVYFPMLKSGDFELMKPQFDFYLRILGNAELRSKVYWNHGGASYTEQIENFGLPNSSEYGWKRPEGYDNGMEYNAWLEYQWDTSLEFCLMMLEQHYYAGEDISEYIPFILSCLEFFEEHYTYLAKNRGRKLYDENKHLVFYPGSACETYKMTTNATSTIAGLKKVIQMTLALPETYLSKEEIKVLSDFQNKIPPINYRQFEDKTTIAPAKSWERMNNTEAPQMYPVYPFSLFGIGRPDLEIAINTFKYDTDLLKFRSHVGWKQDNIFAARLGLTDEAFELTKLKLQDSGRRFPAFWGPGFDYVPDHNWGGSGMIGMQEMLLQTVDNTIYLFPAWPKNVDVHFKLHAQGNTIVEIELRKGEVSILSIEPQEREKDVVVLLGDE